MTVNQGFYSSFRWDSYKHSGWEQLWVKGEMGFFVTFCDDCVVQFSNSTEHFKSSYNLKT